jgi:hypothetical protein
MKISDFEELKKKIENAKVKKARLEGAIKESLARLKAEYDCDSLEEAKVKLESLKKERASSEAKREVVLKHIDEAVEWDSL